MLALDRYRDRHILIIDDHGPLRQSIKSILTELGFQHVDQASNGRDAVALLQKQHYHCIVSDWNMPVMDGLALLEWVRTNPSYGTTPFMLLTAEATRSRIRSALLRGVNDYLIKPFTTEQFRQRFIRLIEGKATPTQLPATETPVIGLPATDIEGLRKSVMIVDDTADNIEVAAGILEKDYEIRVAISGQKALELIAKQPPDLILLDIMMPDMDGMEVCRQLKGNPATQGIPVIFMTAKDQPDDVAAGLDLGAVDYIVKPVNATVLRARVRTHLRLAQNTGQLRAQSSTLAEHARLREEVELIARHDLKSPLQAALIATEHLLADPGIGPRQRDMAQMVADAVRAAAEQVNRTLDLFKIETGSFLLEAKPFNLTELLSRLATEVETTFLVRNINVDRSEATGGVQVMGDANLTGSLLGNLLRNAAEASPDQGTITASLRQDANKVVLQLHNQGAVPEAVRNTFFDKYATAGKAGGTGLGTYSARRYAEAQNGSLDMETDDATGTTLTLVLPA